MEICFLRENPRFCSITLQVDNSPIKHFLLKFDVTGVNGQTVTNAKLCLYNKNGATEGGDFYPVSDDSWQEQTVTWDNAPAADTTQLAALGAVSPNIWYEVDLTSLITADGIYSLRVSDSVGGADYSSKEGSNSPKLLVSVEGAPVQSCAPAATATATPGPTNTPTLTATPGPSPTPTNTSTATLVPTPTANVTPSAPFNSASFVYDGDGKRVKSIFNGTTTTYFVGGHYEVTGSTITKYYYAGGQRIAMRTNGTLNYLLGDHLGSTSLTTNASGQVVSELRYKAWGETRYASGNMPAKYQYTGQYSYESDFGLYFYNARWYDSSLGRFAQADTIIPGGVQGYDRYAYSNNNPIVYTDPTGHFPWPIVIGVGVLIVGHTSLHVFGILPDYRGIAFAEEHVTDKNTIVAAGLAVQSEWYLRKWDDPTNEASSSYGPAQIIQDEIVDYELEGQDLHDPELAVEVMTSRINDVVNACPQCIDRDKVILAALAQNGSEYALNTLENVSSLQLLPDEGLDWGGYFDTLNPTGGLYDLRAVGHHNYDSRFMLHLFMNNLKGLGRRGWNLPELKPEDWKYIDELRWGWD